MKVRAKKMGFYKNRRIREGEAFEIAGEHEFSKLGWMERIEEKAEAKSSKKSSSKPQKQEVEEQSSADLEVI